ncbi:MAG: hypothetical protein GY858_05900 [Candidatus Omnitrophica bacterium]|nr:hypothetical protein [Candidatus Omnitrophota bacterium]
MAKHKTYFKVYNNLLFYSPDPGFAHKTKVSGVWSLDKKHNLIFIVDESQNSVFGKTISFSTRIEKASKGKIEFSILHRLTPTLKNVKRISFKGNWKTTPKNKLAFSVRGNRAKGEFLFSNNYKFNKNNQITYSYRRTLSRKSTIDSFILRGKCKFLGNVFKYKLENSTKPLFSRYLSIERKVINPKGGKIDFTLGLSAKAKNGQGQKISLFGRWKINKTRLEFSVDKQTLRFILNKKLTNTRDICFRLVDKKNEPLGYELIFRKKILKTCSFYIKAKTGKKEQLQVGFHFPF